MGFQFWNQYCSDNHVIILQTPSVFTTVVKALFLLDLQKFHVISIP